MIMAGTGVQNKQQEHDVQKQLFKRWLRPEAAPTVTGKVSILKNYSLWQSLPEVNSIGIRKVKNMPSGTG